MGFSHSIKIYQNVLIQNMFKFLEDMIIPDSKSDYINKSIDKVKKLQTQYKEGLITFGERYNKIIDNVCFR